MATINTQEFEASACIRLVGAVINQAITDQVEHLLRRRKCVQCEGVWKSNGHHCCYRNTCGHDFTRAQNFLFRGRELENFIEHYKIPVNSDHVRKQALKLIRERSLPKDTAAVYAD